MTINILGFFSNGGGGGHVAARWRERAGRGLVCSLPEITLPPQGPGSQTTTLTISRGLYQRLNVFLSSSWDTFFLELIPQPWLQFLTQTPGRGPTEGTAGEALPNPATPRSGHEGVWT